MSKQKLYKLAKQDLPRAAQCLREAFREDPLWSIIFKDDPDPEKTLNAFYMVHLLYGLKYGSVFATSADIEGVAVWVPDQYADMSINRMLLSGALLQGMKMGKESVNNLSLMSKDLKPGREKIMLGISYNYLMIIGVSPASQGKGLGNKLLESMKEECSRQSVQIYLETEPEDNLKFYEKHGFEVQQKVMLSDFNVPMWQLTWQP